MASQFVRLPKPSTTIAPVAAKVVVASQSGVGSTQTQVQFTTANAEFNTGGAIGTNCFIATETGYYTCSGFASSPTNSQFIVLYYKINNGSLAAFAPTIVGGAGYYAATGGTFQVYLTKNDQLKLYVYAPQGTATNILFSMVKSG